MPVVYTRLTNNPITLQTLMQQLDTNLVAAGWTREFVDTDAAIGGSGGAPGWGKTPATNTTAGFVVYRMPASGTLERWFVRLEAGWGASASFSNFTLRTQSGTGVNSSTGVLTSPGTLLGMSISASATANNNSGDNYVTAYEHGFLLGLNSSTVGWITGVERRRNLAGAYTSDLVTWIVTGGVSASMTPVGFAAFSTAAAQNLVRSATLGELGAQPMAMLLGTTGITASSNAALPSSYNSSGNTLGYPAGFFTTSGGLGGMLRLIQAWLPNDCAPLSAQTVNIDGADRSYFAISGTGSPITPGGLRLLVATT